MLLALTGDTHDFRVVNDFARSTGWLHGTGKFFASDGIFLYVVLLLVAWWIARRESSPRKLAAAVWSVLAALVALGFGQLISGAADEQRPFVVMHHTLLLVHHAADAGFPSDHATAAGAFAVGLWLVSRWLGAVSTLLALVVAFARIYVGVHFPQDVAAGLALGAVVALLGIRLVVPLLTALIRRLTATPVRPLLVANRQAAA